MSSRGVVAGSIPAVVHAQGGGAMEMVKLPAGFSAGKYDVTQAQYEAVMGKNPSTFKGARRPVENVSWEEAMKFCKRLTEAEAKAGRLPAGMKYSLPTEKQWEYYVAGAPLSQAVTSAKTRRDTTAEVGSLPANKFGFYDVRGNVWQWCLDPIAPGSDARVIRGGCFSNAEPEKLAIGYRFGLTPLFKIPGVGFRCVLVDSRGATAEQERKAGRCRPALFESVRPAETALRMIGKSEGIEVSSSMRPVSRRSLSRWKRLRALRLAGPNCPSMLPL